MGRLRERQEWHLVRALWRADRGLATLWWAILLLRGLLPAAFAVAMGALVGAVNADDPLGGPLTFMGVVFVLLQVLTPLHLAVGYNLGDRTAAWLYDELTDACIEPPGIGHLEDPELGNDLTVAREFDLGMTGPPLSISMDFIAGSLVEMVGGLASAAVLFAFAWWAPLVLAGGWLATHWLLRESAVWRDRNTDEVRSAQRDADYAYRLAVDPPAAKELRLFGLADWTVDRFVDRRTTLHRLQYEATRLRERSVASSLVLVLVANGVVFWAMTDATLDGRLELGQTITFAQAAVGASLIAFGGLNWALDGAAAPDGRGQPAAPGHGPGRRARARRARRRAGCPPGRSASATSPSPTRAAAARRCSTASTSPSPPARRSPSSGRTAPARPRSPSSCAASTTRRAGRIEVDGVDLRELDLDAWRARVTAVFQDFIRFELPLRDNVAPAGADDAAVLAALEEAGGAGLADLATPARQGLPGRHRPLRRAVAARRPRSGAVRRAARRRGRAARRADRAARRARRGGDLRAGPGRHPALHDDPRVAPLLHRAPRRPDLRARARPGRRARLPRRADAARRPLPHDVRPPGRALRRAPRTRRGWSSMSSPEG